MKVFIVDGCSDCFFTAVFEAYKEKECIITSASDVQLGIDSVIKQVETDSNKAYRVRNKLNEYDALAVQDVLLLLRSCDQMKEQVAFNYIKQIMANKAPVRLMLSDPNVLEMTEIRARVTKEIHYMKGFLRFMENAQGVLYAPYSPDNDITDLLAPHFVERFKNQKFVIHDVNRKIAAMYDGNELIVIPADNADVYLSEYEKAFEELWKRYYKSVNIKERPHEKQMKGYMPVRYWEFMPEKNDNEID